MSSLMSRLGKLTCNNLNLPKLMFNPPYRMLDEFGTELESTDTKLDSTMKRIAKVLHMSNGKCHSLASYEL